LLLKPDILISYQHRKKRIKSLPQLRKLSRNDKSLSAAYNVKQEFPYLQLARYSLSKICGRTFRFVGWHPVKTYLMRIRLLRFSIVLSLTAMALTAAAIPPDVKSLAGAVDEHYNHLRSLQAEFTEVYRGSGMERTESGTLWLKKPGKMRWEYRSPKDKLFVSNGKDAWFYVPEDRQARKTEAKKLEDIRSPLAFLLGKTKLEKELQGLSLAPDVSPLQPGNVVLRGVPQALAERISEVLVEITPDHRIARIVIQEMDGAVTEYRFGEMKEDVAIADARFQFKPPEGTETVEGGLGP
jgi:outer membrane lipoprotein carrier protein